MCVGFDGGFLLAIRNRDITTQFVACSGIIWTGDHCARDTFSGIFIVLAQSDLREQNLGRLVIWLDFDNTPQGIAQSRLVA